MTAETIWETDDGKVRVVKFDEMYEQGPLFGVRDVERKILDRRYWYDQPNHPTEEEARKMARKRAEEYHEDWYGEK